MGIFDDISAFSNPFGPPSQGEWNLSRGVYTTKVSNKSMVFFYEKKDPDPSQHTAIDQITDTGGRRIVKYKYPYRDGQRLADLGREAETFSMNITFHGANYQAKLAEFIDVLVNSNEQATVTHPIRGAVTARYMTHEFVHRYDQSNAITIRAVFEEDNTDELAQTNVPQASQDTALRTALQTLTNVQATISNTIFEVGALAKLPSAILNSMNQRLTSLTGQFSRLLGQLGSTFSSHSTATSLAAQSQMLSGGVTQLTSGKTSASTLPPVYQVGLDPTTQAALDSQISTFSQANQITPQQAMFSANQLRQGIATAIAEVNTNFGNDGYDIVLLYRGLANNVQSVVESCLASTQSIVTVYVTPSPMSLRQVAVNTGLTPDDQNAIEALNPYLPSVNYLPAGTSVVVPVAS